MKIDLTLTLATLFLPLLSNTIAISNTQGIVLYNDGSPPSLDKDHMLVIPPNINITYLVENAMVNIRNYMKRGSKKYKIAKLDPYVFHETVIHYKDDIKLEGHLKGQMLNLSSIKWSRLYACLFSMVSQFDFIIHNLTFYGTYDLNGAVADIFPLYGSGDFRFEIDRLNFTITNQLRPQRGDRPLHNQFSHVNLNTIEGAKWNLGNILGGGQLSKIVNNFTNDISVPLIERIIGLLEEFFSGVMGVAIEDVLVTKKASINEIIRYLQSFKRAKCHIE